MAERRVRTTEGAQMFGQPIGSVIDERVSPEAVKQKRSTTRVRLTSIQRQFNAAKATGDLGRMKDLQAEFSAALKAYQVEGGSQIASVIHDLVAQRGRNDIAVGKKKTLND